MNPIGMIAILGMFIAVLGIGHFGENARPLAWGFAISIGVLVHWVNVLQKELDALKSDRQTGEKPGN